jgi:hypothetical protein
MSGPRYCRLTPAATRFRHSATFRPERGRLCRFDSAAGDRVPRAVDGDALVVAGEFGAELGCLVPTEHYPFADNRSERWHLIVRQFLRC